MNRVLKMGGFRPPMNGFLQDLRIGLRMLAKAPGFTLVAVLTLALGIGANSAIFSVVDGVLLAPLPFAHPRRLVRVFQTTVQFNHSSVAYLNFQDWRRLNHSFSDMAAMNFTSFNYTGNGAAQLLNASDISANFFHVLGAPLTLGRSFNAEEDRPGGRPAAILGYGLWVHKFARSRAVLGRGMVLNGKSYTIVGVAPRHFRPYNWVELYAPLAQINPAFLEDRRIEPGIEVFARLRPGARLATARADMKTVALNLARAYPVADSHVGAAVESLPDWEVRGSRNTIWMLLGAVGLVLLIACANVANLLLVRSMQRNREFAMRSALGAGPARLARQLFTESVLLSLAGGILGVGLARLSLAPLLALVPGPLPGGAQPAINLPVLAFTLSIAVLTGILFGLAPLFHNLHLDLQQELKEGGRGGSSRTRAQSLLIVGEIALTLVLLFGAGLMLRSLRALFQLNPGFNPHHVLTFAMALPPGAAVSPVAIRQDLRATTRAVARTPGVEAAGLTSLLPLMGNDSEIGYWTRPGPPPPIHRMAPTLFYCVTPGYRQAMGIPLLRGRFLSAADRAAQPPVVVVDQHLARSAFPGQNPVGKILYAQFIGPLRIVGVVGHISHWGLASDAGAKIQSQVYLAVNQIPPQYLPSLVDNMSVVARARGDALAAVPAIRAAIHRFSIDEPLYQVRTFRQIVRNSENGRRAPMRLLAIFAALALLLAAVGIYGVISFSVAQRTREMGVRQALGANRAELIRLVLRGSLRLSLWGIGCGLLAAVPSALLLKNLLYGVSIADPLTLASVSLLFFAIALAAAWLPARAAASVNPITALRVE